MLEEVRSRLDSWYNALTGLGNSLRDKLSSTTFLQSARLSDETLETLYHGEDMAARICEALPEEALRRGYFLSTEEGDTDLASAVKEYEKRLAFADVLLDAAVWARVFGGATVYLGIDDGQAPDQPVNVDRIRGILFATMMDKRSLAPEKWYSDPLKDLKYGQPKTYRIQSEQMTPGEGQVRTGTIIHESRLLLFSGARTSLRRRVSNNGWSDSVLQKVHDVLIQFNVGWQGTAHLLQDAAQGVFKMKNLVEMIASGEKELLQARMETVELSRSVARAILLDADMESFERASYSFAGVPEVLRSFMLRLAAAARMPVTVLMGQSPAGLNATGESDTRMWYDQVQSYQEKILKPQLQRFYELVFASQDFKGERPEKWDVKFERLWQLTDGEQAALEGQVATKDKTYIDAGVLLAEEVSLCRFKARGFSMETQIDIEARQEMMEAELELAKKKAGEEPTPPPPFGAPPPTEEPPEEPKSVKDSQTVLRLDYIRKVKGKWVIYSEDGKVLGTHDTEEAAKKQLRAIEASKHA